MKQLLTLLFLGILNTTLGVQRDPTSYANIDEVALTELDLDLEVDFDQKRLFGSAVLRMVSRSNDLKSVILDAEGMQITKITVKFDGETEQTCNYFMTRPQMELGDKVEVLLPEPAPIDTDILLKLYYFTNDRTTAIKFIDAEQTEGKQMPMMYTYCGQTGCRSIAPMPDTPAMKFQVQGIMKVPTGLKMQAGGIVTHDTNNGTHSFFQFLSEAPIASHLIGFAIGDFQNQTLENSTIKVYAEQSQMDETKAILVETPTLFNNTQDYLIPNPWQYQPNFIRLPACFPVAGEPNVYTMFLSPTVLASDQSQINKATTMMANMWLGNIVTAENWSNQWLNTAFATFVERKMTGILHPDLDKIDPWVGNATMARVMEHFGFNTTFSSLYPEFVDMRPEDAFSRISQEKGYQLLHFLEQEVVADEAAFQTMLKNWIQKPENLFNSTNYTAFMTHFSEFVQTTYPDTSAQKLSLIDWDAWIKVGGLAPVWQDFTTAKLNESRKIATDYVAGAGDSSPTNFTNFKDYHSSLQQAFMEELISSISTQSQDIQVKILKKIDQDLQLTTHQDPEIASRWFSLTLQISYTDLDPQAKAFASSVGRWDYLFPLYTSLISSSRLEMAQSWLYDNTAFYHPFVIRNLKTMLNIVDGQERGPVGRVYEETSEVKFLI